MLKPIINCYQNINELKWCLFMAINNTGSRRLLVTLTALLQRFAGCIYSLAEAGWSRLAAPGTTLSLALWMLGVARMLWRSKRAALLCTQPCCSALWIWGVWEVGFDFWALTPRSDILVFFGIWLILPFVWRRLGHSCQRRSCRTGGRTAD